RPGRPRCAGRGAPSAPPRAQPAAWARWGQAGTGRDPRWAPTGRKPARSRRGRTRMLRTWTTPAEACVRTAHGAWTGWRASITDARPDPRPARTGPCDPPGDPGPEGPRTAPDARACRGVVG